MEILNSFQRWAKRLAETQGATFAPRGNWCEINGEPCMSRDGVAAELELYPHEVDAMGF